MWFAQIAVPLALQARLGKQLLVKSLRTSDRLEARRQRNAFVDEWRIMFRRLKRDNHDDTTAEVIRWRQHIEDEASPARRKEMRHHLNLVSHIRGVLGDANERLDAEFLQQVGSGKATALTEHLESWLAESAYTARTKADHRHAIGELAKWLKSGKITATVETVTDELAARFKSDGLVAKGVHRRTANKLLSGLRSYWKWLLANGHAQSNPWLGKSLPKGRQSTDERERAFTDSEVVALLSGKADATTRDVMMIGALSGLRLEEIFQVTVADSQDGLFNVRRSKTVAGERIVSAHSQLVAIIARRSEGKQATDFIIEEGQPDRVGREPLHGLLEAISDLSGVMRR